MIAVNFPCRPDLYPHRMQYSWAQISHFVFDALMRAFPRTKVEFFAPGATIPLADSDVLVGNVSDHMLRWKRSIIVDNDNLDVDRWLHGRFSKYGADYPTYHTGWTKPHMEGCLAALLKTSDVAIRRWDSGDESVAAKKAWLLSSLGSVHVLPHPIDKVVFGARYRPEAQAGRMKMLVYHAGPTKNARELIDLLGKLGFTGHDFTVTDNITRAPEIVERIVRDYPIFAHVSVSEGFPYLANEFMCDGVLLYGHEEWWDGYGDDRLTWTYDPARQEENASKLRYLFKPSSRADLRDLRKIVRDRHVGRIDNEWSYFTNILVDEVRKHL